MKYSEAIAQMKLIGYAAALNGVHAPGADPAFAAHVEAVFPGPVVVWANVVGSNGFSWSNFLGALYDAWNQGHLDGYNAGLIADVFDIEYKGPKHGAYVPVGSPKGKEILLKKYAEKLVLA